MAKRKELIEDGKEKYIEMPDFYNMSNVFFLDEFSARRFAELLKAEAASKNDLLTVFSELGFPINF